MKKKITVLVNNKIKEFNKNIQIPGDKSCSIRAILLGSQCIGQSKVKNLLESEDVLTCVNTLKQSLGVKIVKKHKEYLIYGNGLNSFKINKKITKIYVGNSGTFARLICGLLSTYPNKFYLYGDESMNKRDFSRVTEPLEKVGAFFYPKNKKTLPLTIEGTNMPLAQDHEENKGSAQIKSLILLSALSTPGITTVKENKKKISRNHTELFLKRINADIKIKETPKANLISIRGQKNLYNFNYNVSSDPSSAAFLIAITLLTPGSKLTINNVLCNDTRIFFLKILKKMNANIKIQNLKKISGETVGSIIVKSSKLKPIKIYKDIGKLIDELPILFTISALTKGTSIFKNIGDLKYKESNRILESKKIFDQSGIKCKITRDSMKIYGKKKIISKNKKIVIKTSGDHRICMSSLIFALASGIKTKIKNFETVNTSFPNFISIIKNQLGGKVEIKKT
jgi:3-phosphoshikimate 1-carboxyvinyltransferase